MASEGCDAPLGEAQVDQPPPQHLVAMMHGLSGNAKEWLRFEKVMVNHFGTVSSKVSVHFRM